MNSPLSNSGMAMALANDERRSVAVWDLPTRLFHWALALLVCCNLFLISPRGGAATTIHFLSGYAIAGLLLFRLVWGFIGSPRSRFADFLLPWPAVRAYTKRLMRLNPPHSIGHNPLGGWMIAAMLTALLGMVATGLLAASRRASGPLAPLISSTIAHQFGQTHQLISNLMIGLVVLHLAGVLTDWLLTRDNLIKSMITGRKLLSTQDAAREGRLAPAGRAVIVGLIALALMAGLVMVTDFAAS
jgi:cytochrome b